MPDGPAHGTDPLAFLCAPAGRLGSVSDLHQAAKGSSVRGLSLEAKFRGASGFAQERVRILQAPS